MEDSTPSKVEHGDAVTKRRWPLWKTLTIAGVALAIVIGLGVGLGVGLTQDTGNDSNDDSDATDDDASSSNTQDSSPSSTNQTSAWHPSANTTWQIILQNPLPSTLSSSSLLPDIQVYDLDLFENSKDVFDTLHDAGKKVICYFSAGSWEKWAPDADDFDDGDLGKPLEGWPGEKWVNVSSENVRGIMKKRIELASRKGCDAIDPDNVDGYQNKNGLSLTAEDAISYMHFLSAAASSYNMSTGLKNAGSIIPKVLSVVSFSVNEQCVEYSECDTFSAFIDAGKPVFHIEYPNGAPDNVSEKNQKRHCSTKGDGSGSRGFSTVLKTMDLDGWVEYCDGSTFDEKTSDD